MADGNYPTIRDIREQLDEIEALFEASYGEETDEIATKLQHLHGDMNAKLGRLHAAWHHYTNQAATWKARRQALLALMHGAERKAETCMRAARAILEASGYESWNLPDGQVALGRTRVEQTGDLDMSSLEERFVRRPKPSTPRPVPGLTAIGDFLKAGGTLLGFRLAKGVSFK